EISVGNGAASNLSGSGTTYTATITPAADGQVTIEVGAGSAQDSAGNQNTASNQFSVINDQTTPTVSIMGPAGPVSGAFTASFTFSEVVSGFALGDISVGNGAASNLSGAGTTYTATITPASDGQVTVNVSANIAQDTAGNGNIAATQFSVTNDSDRPTLAITGPAGPVSGAFTATFTFSESVTGFALGEISVGNGAASNLSGSGTTYTATITPAAD
ncbi:Ig-like domain-containing protein, partial [Hyphobacterium sp. HN65]